MQKHLEETFSDSFPSRNSADVTQHRRRLSEGLALLHLLDELNAIEVHKAIRVVLLHRLVVVDA